MELREIIKNNINTVGLIALGLIIAFLFLSMVKSQFGPRKE
jgi:hypothetical protein